MFCWYYEPLDCIYVIYTLYYMYIFILGVIWDTTNIGLHRITISYHYPVDVLIQYKTNIWIIHGCSKLTMVAVVDGDDDDDDDDGDEWWCYIHLCTFFSNHTAYTVQRTFPRAHSLLWRYHRDRDSPGRSTLELWIKGHHRSTRSTFTKQCLGCISIVSGR